MPTYEYRCAKCGDELEVFQTFAETPLTKHKGCGGKLAKVLSPAGIVLKGSGFYKTDNRSSSKRSGSKESNGKSDSGDRRLVERVERRPKLERTPRLRLGLRGLRRSGDQGSRATDSGSGGSSSDSKTRSQERLSSRGPRGRRRRVRRVGLLQLSRRRRRDRDRHPVRRRRAIPITIGTVGDKRVAFIPATAAITGTCRRPCPPAPTSGRCGPSVCAPSSDRARPAR